MGKRQRSVQAIRDLFLVLAFQNYQHGTMWFDLDPRLRHNFEAKPKINK
jgi:hypothetical protein